MSYQNFMNKIRQIDNLTARWLMRHFYFTFFQFVLIVVFLFWFVNMFNVIDISLQASKSNLLEQILANQSINLTITVFLMILNSFWLLFIFNAIQRMRTILRDISYNISRLRAKQ